MSIHKHSEDRGVLTPPSPGTPGRRETDKTNPGCCETVCAADRTETQLLIHRPPAGQITLAQIWGVRIDFT